MRMPIKTRRIHTVNHPAHVSCVFHIFGNKRWFSGMGFIPNKAELTTERTENTENDLFMMRWV
jgi:hypothetical protein